MAMPIAKDQSATANACFAATIINRAADIVSQAPRPPSSDYAFAALQQARNECLASEGSKANQFLAYSFPQLLNDLGQHIRARYPAYSQAIAPIGEWSRATPPETVAAALRAAAGTISRLIAQRAIMASRFEMMSDQESAEYNLMRKAAALLTRHGLSVNIDWEREDTDGPIDYRGTVDGVPWAFALAQLRKDPNRGYFGTNGTPYRPNDITFDLGSSKASGEPLDAVLRRSRQICSTWANCNQAVRRRAAREQAMTPADLWRDDKLPDHAAPFPVRACAPRLETHHPCTTSPVSCTRMAGYCTRKSPSSALQVCQVLR